MQRKISSKGRKSTPRFKGSQKREKQESGEDSNSKLMFDSLENLIFEEKIPDLESKLKILIQDPVNFLKELDRILLLKLGIEKSNINKYLSKIEKGELFDSYVDIKEGGIFSSNREKIMLKIEEFFKLVVNICIQNNQLEFIDKFIDQWFIHSTDKNKLFRMMAIEIIKDLFEGIIINYNQMHLKMKAKSANKNFSFEAINKENLLAVTEKYLTKYLEEILIPRLTDGNPLIRSISLNSIYNLLKAKFSKACSKVVLEKCFKIINFSQLALFKKIFEIFRSENFEDIDTIFKANWKKLFHFALHEKKSISLPILDLISKIVDANIDIKEHEEDFFKLILIKNDLQEISVSISICMKLDLMKKFPKMEFDLKLFNKSIEANRQLTSECIIDFSNMISNVLSSVSCESTQIQMFRIIKEMIQRTIVFWDLKAMIDIIISSIDSSVQGKLSPKLIETICYILKASLDSIMYIAYEISKKSELLVKFEEVCMSQHRKLIEIIIPNMPKIIEGFKNEENILILLFNILSSLDYRRLSETLNQYIVDLIEKTSKYFHHSESEVIIRAVAEFYANLYKEREGNESTVSKVIEDLIQRCISSCTSLLNMEKIIGSNEFEFLRLNSFICSISYFNIKNLNKYNEELIKKINLNEINSKISLQVLIYIYNILYQTFSKIFIEKEEDEKYIEEYKKFQVIYFTFGRESLKNHLDDNFIKLFELISSSIALFGSDQIENSSPNLIYYKVSQELISQYNDACEILLDKVFKEEYEFNEDPNNIYARIFKSIQQIVLMNSEFFSSILPIRLISVYGSKLEKYPFTKKVITTFCQYYRSRTDFDNNLSPLVVFIGNCIDSCFKLNNGDSKENKVYQSSSKKCFLLLEALLNSFALFNNDKNFENAKEFFYFEKSYIQNCMNSLENLYLLPLFIPIFKKFEKLLEESDKKKLYNYFMVGRRKIDSLNPDLEEFHKNIFLQVKNFFYHVLKMKKIKEKTPRNKNKSSKNEETAKNEEGFNDIGEDKENIKIEPKQESQNNQENHENQESQESQEN